MELVVTFSNYIPIIWWEGCWNQVLDELGSVFSVAYNIWQRWPIVQQIYTNYRHKENL